MNKMEKNHNDRWAYWILLITALWYCVLGSFYLIAGITDLIALSRNKIHDNWWCLYFLIGLFTFMGASYLIWGSKKTIKYIVLSCFILGLLFWASFILLPNAFPPLGDVAYILYFLLGILFSVISIKKVRLVEPREYM